VYEEEIIGAEQRHIGYVCILIDVTYERICSDLLDKAAYYDYLTDTKNRRCFYEELVAYKGKEISLIYLDLDHFKEINDTCGHDMGDAVLCKCLGVLKQVFGKDSVYRIGGDEFTIIIEGSDDEAIKRGLEVVKDNIRAMAPEHIALDISFGISHTTDLQDIDAFIEISDKMMYKAKGER
jgi:diguanylate cyclase (GGDEF)-like protein